MNIADVLDVKGRTTVSIAPTASLGEASGVLAARQVGSLVVTDETGRLIGILTERDVVRALADADRWAVNLTVFDAMTRFVRTCAPTDGIHQAMAMMARWRIRHLPVVEDEKVLGMVSVRDLLQVLLDRQSKEADSLLTIGRCRPGSVARIA